MAKGMEDTAFYDYNRLLSLNEVGGDPGRFGSARSVSRVQPCPPGPMAVGLSTTSTHDTKRSEDVRAPINVLSEIPERMVGCLERWSGSTSGTA